MKCIGWHWTQKVSLKEIAARMKLNEVAEFSTGDIAGVREGILVLVHVIWGSTKEVEKILICAHDIPSGKEDMVFQELTKEL